MRFYSTSHKFKGISFKQAVRQGFAPDGGLYLPESLPKFSFEFLKKCRELSFLELSLEIASLLFSEEFSPKTLEKICEAALDFPTPFFSISNEIHLLELFHGPTLSFKDFGAKFLAEIMRHWKEEATVLVATSGDTGSAVGHAFLGIPHTQVFILYPKGRVTPIQENQLTSFGQNVQALEVEGSFEDCQELLKKAVLDPTLSHITVANSINVGRLLPQIFYYFYAYLQLPEFGKEALFSVPCGNFGNLVSGILAKRLNLPIMRFLAATNINDEIPLLLRSGVFKPHPAYQTIAVSMDVGNPSNFPRLLELYHSDLNLMRHDLLGTAFTDLEIKKAILDLYHEKGYLLDPHSAISYLALKEYLLLEHTRHPTLFFATAHPSKFPNGLPIQIPLPPKLQEISFKKGNFLSIGKEYKEFRELLLKAAVK